MEEYCRLRILFCPCFILGHVCVDYTFIKKSRYLVLPYGICYYQFFRFGWMSGTLLLRSTKGFLLNISKLKNNFLDSFIANLQMKGILDFIDRNI